MEENQEILVRMFFENGHIETRPRSWVIFMGAEDRVDETMTEEDRKVVEGGGEVYLCFREKLIALQFYRGHFVDAKQFRHQHGGSNSERRFAPQRPYRDNRDDPRGYGDPSDR